MLNKINLQDYQLLPVIDVMSMQKVKGQGHRGQSKISSNLGVSGP